MALSADTNLFGGRQCSAYSNAGQHGGGGGAWGVRAYGDGAWGDDEAWNDSPGWCFGGLTLCYQMDSTSKAIDVA